MTIALKINLTDEEKNTFSKARELADKLGDIIRNVADNTTGLDEDVIYEMYSHADICDVVCSRLNDLCDEFDID